MLSLQINSHMRICETEHGSWIQCKHLHHTFEGQVERCSKCFFLLSQSLSHEPKNSSVIDCLFPNYSLVIMYILSDRELRRARKKRIVIVGNPCSPNGNITHQVLLWFQLVKTWHEWVATMMYCKVAFLTNPLLLWQVVLKLSHQVISTYNVYRSVE